MERIDITELPDEYVVLSLETTGLRSKSDRIIEIAALRYENGEETEYFESLISGNIPPMISEMTGITQEMLSDAPEERTVILQLREFIANSAIVCYNAHFDITFLNNALFRNGRAKLKNQVLDLQQIICGNDPESKCSLQKAAKDFGIIQESPHRAICDAETVQLLLQSVLSDIPEQAQESPVKRKSIRELFRKNDTDPDYDYQTEEEEYETEEEERHEAAHSASLKFVVAGLILIFLAGLLFVAVRLIFREPQSDSAEYPAVTEVPLEQPVEEPEPTLPEIVSTPVPTPAPEQTEAPDPVQPPIPEQYVIPGIDPNDLTAIHDYIQGQIDEMVAGEGFFHYDSITANEDCTVFTVVCNSADETEAEWNSSKDLFEYGRMYAAYAGTAEKAMRIDYKNQLGDVLWVRNSEDAK